MPSDDSCIWWLVQKFHYDLVCLCWDSRESGEETTGGIINLLGNLPKWVSGWWWLTEMHYQVMAALGPSLSCGCGLSANPTTWVRQGYGVGLAHKMRSRGLWANPTTVVPGSGISQQHNSTLSSHTMFKSVQFLQSSHFFSSVPHGGS